MVDFFQTRTTSKCDGCLLGKKYRENKKKLLDRDLSYKDGNPNSKLLIVLSRLESEKMMFSFKKLLSKHQIYDYCIIAGIQCATENMKDDLTCDRYVYCNTFDLNKFPNVEVIMTLGSGIYAVTKTTDITHWGEFREFQFNQTHFYTGFNYDKQVPVYPLPYIDSLIYDSFEKWFAVNIQFEKVRKLLNES